MPENNIGLEFVITEGVEDLSYPGRIIYKISDEYKIVFLDGETQLIPPTLVDEKGKLSSFTLLGGEDIKSSKSWMFTQNMLFNNGELVFENEMSINGILEDNYGGVWVVMTDGLYHFRKNLFDAFNHENSGLRNIYPVYRGASEIIWSGDLYGEIYRYQENELTTIQKILSGRLFSFQEDSKGNTWAGDGLLAYLFAFDNYETGIPENGGWPKTLANFGNPFGWDLSIDSLITALVEIDPLTNQYVYRWNPISKEYELEFSGGIKPYEVVFIRTITSGLDATITLEYDDSYDVTPEKAVVEQPFQFVHNHSEGKIQSRFTLQFSEEEALVGIDPFDGYYLGSYANFYANLYTQIGDQNLTINNLPTDLNEVVEFLIYLDATVSGDFDLNWNKELLPKEWKFTLKEVATGLEIDLMKQNQFSFSNGVKAKIVVSNDTDQSKDASEEVDTELDNNSAGEIRNNKFKQQGSLQESVSSVKSTTANERTAKAKASSEESGDSSNPLFVLTINPLTSTGNEDGLGIPTEVELNQNYPNPFNPTSVIRFGVPNTAKVQLEVFDILGRRVATLLNNETKQAGRYNVIFDARNLASGMYIYRLVIGDHVMTKKMTLIK